MPDFCGTCGNLDFTLTYEASKRDNSIRSIHQTILMLSRQLRRFEESSQAGCDKCRLVCSSLSHHGIDVDEHPASVLYLHRTGACYYYVISGPFTIQLYTPIGRQREILLSSYTKPSRAKLKPLPIGRPCAWPGITWRDEISERAGSKEAFSFIESCLATCDAHHNLCHSESSPFPTRLIEVGDQRDSTCRLVETVGGSNGRYLAVSYCWGKGTNFTTTISNVQAMKSGFLVSSLPQTLQDAVLVTRTIGAPYLWIDSLCIIQDSARDWEIESSRMASVYQNAYLTIAVATAAAASEGFLHHRHAAADFPQPFETSWPCKSGGSSIIRARMIPDGEAHSDGFFEEPLDQRGWTLQESRLSPRLLTYAQDELRWDCLTLENCECAYLSTSIRDEFQKRTAILTCECVVDAHIRWPQVVSEFTTRQLTQPLDKLPALSGIAKKVHSITGAQYIAGLWRDNMLNDLLWSCVGPDVACPAAYQAPSFSWASINGPVIFTVSDYDWIFDATVLDTSAIIIGQNPFGRILEGSLTLRGRMLKAEVVVATDNRFFKYSLKNGDETYTMHADVGLENFEIKDTNGTTERCIRRSPFGSTKVLTPTPMPAFIFWLGQGPFRQTKQVFGVFLVLGKSPRKSSCYERLGICFRNLQNGAEAIQNAPPTTITLT